jgi:N-methylhydantoinase B
MNRDNPARISPEVDPITFSVVLNRLQSIATEMTHALENAAFTSFLSLLCDYSCCIYDARARQVAVKDAIPIHTNSMHLVLGEIDDFFGGDINEGDVIVCNDPYRGNTHVGDLVTAHPVFHEGVHMFWTVARGHQLDVGAPVPHSAHGGAENVYQEGVFLPPVKMYEAGKERKDAVEWYLANLRYPELLRGDLMAQFGAIWTGGRRLVELCERYGNEQILSFVEEVLVYAERRTRAEIREMPNGAYTAEGWLDTDGGDATDQRVTVKVTIHDETIDVDFAGSDPAGAYGLNSSFATMQAAGGIPVMMAIDPDIPHNEGCLRLVKVSAPLGTLCNAAHPSATAMATTQPTDLMQDVVAMALAKAIPERMRAGGCHLANTPMFAGVDDRDGTDWGHMAINGGGGGAAAKGVDGWPLLVTQASWGGLKLASVEHTELLYPIRIDGCEVEIDSMGLGEYIGGPGIRCAIRTLHGDVDVIYTSDGLTNPPFGVGGGTAGAGGGAYLEEIKTGKRRFLHSAMFPLGMSREEVWVGVSTGGGGYGDPLERPVERVVADVRDGYYSAEKAREVFGVVLTEALDLDAPATTIARAEIAVNPAVPGSVVPDAPRSATWFVDEMREGEPFISPSAIPGFAPMPGTTNAWSARPTTDLGPARRGR